MDQKRLMKRWQWVLLGMLMGMAAMGAEGAGANFSQLLELSQNV